MKSGTEPQPRLALRTATMIVSGCAGVVWIGFATMFGSKLTDEVVAQKPSILLALPPLLAFLASSALTVLFAFGLISARWWKPARPRLWTTCLALGALTGLAAWWLISAGRPGSFAI